MNGFVSVLMKSISKGLLPAAAGRIGLLGLMLLFPSSIVLADPLRGRTILIDVSLPICGYKDGTQSCIWEHSAWFYLAAIFMNEDKDLFYSLSFHSNYEAEGVRIVDGTNWGERSKKAKSGDTVIDGVFIKRPSDNIITAVHTSEWVEKKYIRKNEVSVQINEGGCQITYFRQEHFSDNDTKFAYGLPKSLRCQLSDGPQTTVYGD